MDIGETVVVEGRRFTVRGFDPEGVDPRFVYIEDAKTGETKAVAFAELSRMAPGSAVLHLVDEDEPA